MSMLIDGVPVKPQRFWTPYETSQLIEWRSMVPPVPYSTIGVRLGRKKNSVANKAHDLGMSIPTKKPVAEFILPKEEPVVPRLPLPPSVSTPDLSTMMAALYQTQVASVRGPTDGQCQFRAGHSGDWMQCDNPASAFRDDGTMAPEGRVWCLECRRKVYRRVTDADRRIAA